jgi:hypothetical protein
MSYDAATVAMLRAVLDELLVSEAFTHQNQCSAVDMAQYILRLALKRRTGRAEDSHVQTCCRNALPPS